MTRNVSKTSEKPLLGAVLCCTSIAAEDRTRLAEYAEHMGAEHKLDLTSDVTHLLVGSTDTLKYQYVAREREDVKVLRPEWIEAVRKCWMEDQQLDMNALEAEYRVPTLAGLKICITGFDDLTFRAQLQKNVVTNGGQYTGDLTKDVTHLIAANTEGKKYEYATLWQKKVVSLQWYKDTLERGMQLDESTYHPTRSPEEQGIGAWNRQERQQSTIGKRTRDEHQTQEPTRKLRRTASAKLTSQTDDMWGDIVGQPSQQAHSSEDVLRAAKSLPSMRDERLQKAVAEKEEHQLQLQKITHGSELGFLDGTFFTIMKFGDRQEALVSRTLQAAGAVVLGSIVELITHEAVNPSNTYLIVPYQTRSRDLPSFGKSNIRPAIVTELWLERCVLQKALIPPIQYPLGGIISDISDPEIGEFTVNATGFQSIETLHIAKTVGLTGAKYTEVFTPKSSVLVCNSMNVNEQKVFHARQWQVPVVTESWLCKFLAAGSIPDFEVNQIKGQEEEEEDTNDLEAEMLEKRKTRHLQRPHDNDEGSDAEGGPSISTNLQSATSTFADKGTAPHRQNDNKQGKDSRNSKQGQQDTHKSRDAGAAVLQEISPNSPTRKDRPTILPAKKSLFRTFDGADAATENKLKVPEPHPPISDGFAKPKSPKKLMQDTNSINSAIDDLLNMKAKAKANASAPKNGRQDRKGRLLSRALSNLSNASHGSRQSRASSIDSLNTDGVGSEIAPTSGKSTGAERFEGEIRTSSIQARTHNRMSPAINLEVSNQNAPIDLSDPNFLRDEYVTEEAGPQLTQLGYEDSEEAIALRERLAEKRRARTRLGQKDGDPTPELTAKERAAALKQKQKEKQVIKDDDLFTATGWGGGRRTRAKNRSTDMNDLETF